VHYPAVITGGRLSSSVKPGLHKEFTHYNKNDIPRTLPPTFDFTASRNMNNKALSM